MSGARSLPFFGSLKCWRPVFALMGVCCLARLGWSGPTQEASQTPPLHPEQAVAAQIMRGWMSGQFSLIKAAQHATDRPGTAPELAEWMDYILATGLKDPQEREKAFKAVYEQTGSQPLRAACLRSISQDPYLQSRQALFIRRYGFYANWFNRLTYTSFRFLQGNITAVLQLGVDGVSDLFHSSQASAYDRMVWARMQQASRVKASSPLELSQRDKLRRKIERTEAKQDLAQARWALENNLPPAALFYASQALEGRPQWGKAQRTRNAAAAAVARQRRQAMSSTQVGYPDRIPPVTLAPAQVVRDWLTGQPSRRGTPALFDILSPAPGQGSVQSMEQWAQALDGLPSAARASSEMRWLAALLRNPAANPNRRLELAQHHLLGHRFSFIFTGDRSASEHIYDSASLLTQTYDTLSSIGFFYVFEVIGRTVQVLVASPVPQEQTIDARAHWLANCSKPLNKEAQKAARQLSRDALKREHFEQARAWAGQANADDKWLGKIDRQEGRWWGKVALAHPAGPLRTEALEKVKTLNPAWAKSVGKQLEKADRRTAPQAKRLRMSWSQVTACTSQPLPAGFPGLPEWFDGQPGNGEVTAADEVYFEFPPQPSDELKITYRIQKDGQILLNQSHIKTDQLDPTLAGWLRVNMAQATQADQTIRQLKRLPIPFEVEGGVGSSGMDLYPKLDPMPLKKEQIELYQ